MNVKAQFPDEQTQNGEFTRQDDVFRGWVTADGSSGYPAIKDRYHLYVSWACPWAHRTIIVRKLKRLESLIGMTVVDPIRDERRWAFREGPGHSKDPINGFHFLSEAYRASDPNYNGRVTVPVLWDKIRRRIVSNSDDDIMRMFNSEFAAMTSDEVDLYPAELRGDIDRLNATLYETVNNGVYRAGFATAQKSYEGAVRRLFDTLDMLEDRLSRQRNSRYGRFRPHQATLLRHAH
jgi:glutathionyl-hydroquinone reductase